MHFAMLFYETDEDFANRENANAPEVMGAWAAYQKALGEAGVCLGGNALQPPETATSISNAKGVEHKVQDGPYPDSKEQLGGLMILDVPSIDEALQWASRCPTAATGTVEVRPIWAPPGM